jgi:SAM-dependent methyltransferase
MQVEIQKLRDIVSPELKCYKYFDIQRQLWEKDHYIRDAGLDSLKGRKILEIGPGFGWAAWMLQQLGHKVDLLESNIGNEEREQMAFVNVYKQMRDILALRGMLFVHKIKTQHKMLSSLHNKEYDVIFCTQGCFHYGWTQSDCTFWFKDMIGNKIIKPGGYFFLHLNCGDPFVDGFTAMRNVVLKETGRGGLFSNINIKHAVIKAEVNG